MNSQLFYIWMDLRENILEWKTFEKGKKEISTDYFEETWAPKEFELEIILEEGDIGISNGYSKTDVGRIDCFMVAAP